MARNLKNSEDINVNATDEEISLEFARDMSDTEAVDKKISDAKDELNKTITEKTDALTKTDQEMQKSISELSTKESNLETKVNEIANFNFDDVITYGTCTEEELQRAIDASD